MQYLQCQEDGIQTILFMDINLKGENGISAAKQIKKLYSEVCIIFISGYVNQLQDTFDVDPVFYLVKPIEEKYLDKALKKALSSLKKEEPQRLALSTKLGIYHVETDSITYVESNKRQLIIHSTAAGLFYLYP